MKAQGKIRDITRSLDGKLLLSFEVVGDVSELRGLRDESLDITVTKHRNRRSNDANAYMWKLCDMIAQKVGATSREAVYLRMLREYGRFEDVLIRSDAAQAFEAMTKYCEELYEVDGWTCVRVYQGSHEYDSKAMSILIDGVVTEAKDLGIETMTPNELARMTATWKGTI